jgi:starch-binding outer membrane protein, SusD/RagB family
MGARFAKFDYTGSNADLPNDFPIYRYADILLIKAEALMRQNAGNATSEAVNLVNLIRNRAFNDPSKNYTIETLTLDTLLSERGWEFYNQ